MADIQKTSEFIVEQILPDVRKGRMLILVDDEDRENEGDLFVAAERATPEAINFMASRARGLVSLALTEERMRRLGLSLIESDEGNTTKFQTAFATPIDARAGVSSGMSAHDRARTIAVAIADDARPADLIRPRASAHPAGPDRRRPGAARATPKRRWILRAWPASSPPASSARS